jgi:Flp pilus assembly protein TadB
MRQRLQEIIQRFREKGAASPEKAMTIQELGLPPRFEQAMHRRLGQTGIFVEVNGKYYLNEDRLKQIQEQRAQRGAAGAGGGGYNRQSPPGWLRYSGILVMLPIGIIVVAFLLFYFYVYNPSAYFPGEILLILLIVLVVMFAVRMLFWRARRNYWRERQMQNRAPYEQ